MNVGKFEILAGQVHKGKKWVEEARARYEAAITEMEEANKYEREAYVEFMKFVRESAGLQSEIYS